MDITYEHLNDEVFSYLSLKTLCNEYDDIVDRVSKEIERNKCPDINMRDLENKKFLIEGALISKKKKREHVLGFEMVFRELGIGAPENFKGKKNAEFIEANKIFELKGYDDDLLDDILLGHKIMDAIRHPYYVGNRERVKEFERTISFVVDESLKGLKGIKEEVVIFITDTIESHYSKVKKQDFSISR